MASAGPLEGLPALRVTAVEFTHSDSRPEAEPEEEGLARPEANWDWVMQMYINHHGSVPGVGRVQPWALDILLLARGPAVLCV
jgi:hypothetical protein